jgi:hypothetical protein
MTVLSVSLFFFVVWVSQIMASQKLIKRAALVSQAYPDFQVFIFITLYP